MADEDFDTFDDEEMRFVIKTKKPKVIVKKDAKEETPVLSIAKESQGKNEAITMQVKEAHLFSKLKNINARYLVIDLRLKNILKSQKVIVSNGSTHPSSWINKSSDDYEYKEAIPPYQIPDVMQHLYVRVNNANEHAIDMMSFLLDNTLLDYDTNTVNVLPEKLKEGVLAFRLPQGKKIEQLSLHYYDTKYGNIDIPIIGEMKSRATNVTALPKKAWKKMNDNFSLAVSGYEVENKIGEHSANKNAQFEIVEVDIESKVYALLKFNPAERFYLKLGDKYQLKLHPLTQELPMGLYSDASLSPGSNNKFRLAFYVPKGLESLSRSLMVELKGKDIVLPIKKGNEVMAQNTLGKGSVEGTSLEINGVYTHGDKMLVALTFIDEEDGYSTRLHDTFYLNVKPEIPNKNDANAYPLVKSSDKVLGYKNKEVILDGMKKSVFLWFDNPFKQNVAKTFYLVSPLFEDLKFKIDKKPTSLPETLNYALLKEYPYLTKQDSVDKRVLAMVKAFKAKKEKENISNGSEKQHVATLEKKKRKSRYVTIPPMTASDYGEERVAKLKTVDDVIVALKTLQWIPSAYDITTAIYSTSAIFTQGWGSENEMFRAIYDRVKEKNVKFGSYGLTDAGTLELLKQAKAIPLQNKVPFIEWEEKGVNHSLVFPFLKPIADVEKYISNKAYMTEIKHAQTSIEMTLTYLPKNDGTATKSFGMFGSALGGGTTTEQTNTIFKKSWNIDEVSSTPIDIYFPQTTAFYTDGNGTHKDMSHTLKDKKVEPKVLTIQITMPDGKLDTYTHYFKEKEALQDVFFTFALGTPDIPRNVLNAMENKREKLFKNKKIKQVAPDSFLKWLNRAKIYKFITMQTAYDKRLENTLGIQAKHNKSPRAVMALLENIPHLKPVSSLDLRRIFTDVYGDENTTHSFNIMSGIFNAQAEAKVIRNGKGIFDFWKEKDINITMIYPAQKSSIIDIFKSKGVDERIIKRLSESEKVWLYPMNKKKELGWLEIDPKTYHIVSVSENGMYAAMTEEAEVETLINDASQYFLGYFAGTFYSVYTMIDSILLIPDFCEAVKVAENTANNVACGVGAATSPFTGIGILGAGLGCAGLSNEAMEVSVTASMAGNKTIAGKALGGFLGFGNGFGNAVAVFFHDMKQGSTCK